MIVQGQCTSFKSELYQGIHNLLVDNIYIALYTANANLNQSTSFYTTVNEVIATGYTAGGVLLTNPSVNSDNAYTAYVSFANAIWNGAITARGALIYNASKQNRAIAVLDFGSDRSSAQQFSVILPANTADSAIIRSSTISYSYPQSASNQTILALLEAAGINVPIYTNPGLLSVLAWGATNDGSTDSTTAIQNAMNAQSVLYFPTGIYVISSSLLSGNAPMTWVGDGQGVSIIIIDANTLPAPAVLKHAPSANYFGYDNSLTLKDLTVACAILPADATPPTPSTSNKDAAIKFMGNSNAKLIVENIEVLSVNVDQSVTGYISGNLLTIVSYSHPTLSIPGVAVFGVGIAPNSVIVAYNTKFIGSIASNTTLTIGALTSGTIIAGSSVTGQKLYYSNTGIAVKTSDNSAVYIASGTANPYTLSGIPSYTLTNIIAVNTSGVFECDTPPFTFAANQQIVISGTFNIGGITGYISGTTYYVISTNTTLPTQRMRFTLSASSGGGALTTLPSIDTYGMTTISSAVTFVITTFINMPFQASTNNNDTYQLRTQQTVGSASKPISLSFYIPYTSNCWFYSGFNVIDSSNIDFKNVRVTGPQQGGALILNYTRAAFLIQAATQGCYEMNFRSCTGNFMLNNMEFETINQPGLEGVSVAQGNSNGCFYFAKITNTFAKNNIDYNANYRPPQYWFDECWSQGLAGFLYCDGASNIVVQKSNISLNNSYSSGFALIVKAINIIAGTYYQIKALGTSDFTAFGAATNTVGVRFTASSSGTGSSGTGQVVIVPNGTTYTDVFYIGNSINVSIKDSTIYQQPGSTCRYFVNVDSSSANNAVLNQAQTAGTYGYTADVSIANNHFVSKMYGSTSNLGTLTGIINVAAGCVDVNEYGSHWEGISPISNLSSASSVASLGAGVSAPFFVDNGGYLHKPFFINNSLINCYSKTDAINTIYSWTPIVYFGGTSLSSTGSYTSSGSYRIIDNMLLFSIVLTNVVKGTSAGTFSVQLPTNVIPANANYVSTGALDGAVTYSNMAAGMSQPSITVDGSNNLNLVLSGSTATSLVTAGNFSGSSSSSITIQGSVPFSF